MHQIYAGDQIVNPIFLSWENGKHFVFYQMVFSDKCGSIFCQLWKQLNISLDFSGKKWSINQCVDWQHYYL